MDWIFNNWNYQILPMVEAIEIDENNNNYKITNKKNFTEEYEIYYRNGILSFDSFESLESLKEKCGMNYDAIIYIIKNNDHYKNINDNLKKIIKIISDISNNEEVSYIIIRCLIVPFAYFFIDYELTNNNEKYRIGSRKEINECIEELKGNLVMLDMYIRKKLKNEYPELFI